MSFTPSQPIALFDRGAWRQHRNRAAQQGCADFLYAEIAERLIDRLEDIQHTFDAALDLGAHCGALSRALAARSGIRNIVVLEPAPLFLQQLAGIRTAADPDVLPFRDQSFDLVVSELVLHWAIDLPGALIQLRRVLKPDGLLLAAIFGGATLIELRTALIEAELAEESGASPRVSPTVDLADAAGLLQRAGFAMPVADADKIIVNYPDIVALMRDLRGLGETNALAARRRGMFRRGTLARAAAIYADRFGNEDGRIQATFEVLYLTGWAPDASLPQRRRKRGMPPSG
jgi:NADH dehydrogenase [ubiquinone] 1 alpha subcomplex assembly factor 5